MTSLAERYDEVLGRISHSAAVANRNADEIKLIVVTKNHSAALVTELLDLGARDFGENRDQEAKPKAADVAAHEMQLGLQRTYDWHFVGQLQSNKVKSAISYADTVHSLDRDSLLEALMKATAERANPLDVFIELNLTDDAGRGGIEPKHLEAFAEKVIQQPKLRLLGVMGVAGLEREPAAEFAVIRGASETLQKVAPSAKFISAGMSEDFEAAILAGATHLRIGTAITGKRQY